MAGQGRKPVTAPGLTRQALWTEMRRLKQFTVPELCRASAQFDAAYLYLRALCAAGYVRREERSERNDHRFAPYRYVVIRDAGIDAPRLRRDGGIVTQGLAREQLWRSMRILRRFNATELRVAASTEVAPVSDADTKRYISRLHRAGYLHCIQPAAPGRLARYRLLPTHTTGPRPPMVQANGHLYDPNLGRVVWQPPSASETGDG